MAGRVGSPASPEQVIPGPAGPEQVTAAQGGSEQVIPEQVTAAQGGSEQVIAEQVIPEQVATEQGGSEPVTKVRAAALARRWHAVLLVGGGLGVASAIWQTVERIAYAAGADSQAVCEINSVVSCNSVFSHWQSSALGLPNSLVALPVFTAIAFTGLAGLLGSRMSRSYLATVFGLTIFMVAFITWYMQQSAFAIGALCIFCTACAVSVLIAGVGVTRVVAAEQALGRGRAGRLVTLLTRSNADIIAWVGLGLIIALMLYLGLAY